MKNLYLILLSLFALTASAKQIDRSEAKEIANVFLEKNHISRVLNKESEIQNFSTYRAGDLLPYYVLEFEKKEGFIIISGDDSSNPIVGYSLDSSFKEDKLPPQLKFILNSVSKKIPNANSPNDEFTLNDNFNYTNTDNSKLLPTRNFGQYAPYNDDCPVKGGEKCVTGCVATAMAIIMDYHKWPETGRGSYYSANNRKSYNFENLSLPWDKIEAGESEPISQLMYANGMSVDMDYGTKESGAHSYMMFSSFSQYFKYSPKCQYIKRGNFSDEEWHDIMRNQIDSGYPFIYSAQENNHAWVVDGYDSNGLYHCNWGWNGDTNGFFNLDLFKYFHDGITIDIIPDRTSDEISPVYMNEMADKAVDELKIDVQNVESGKEFFTEVNYRLDVRDKFTGDIGFALFNKEGKIKEIFYSREVIGYKYIWYVSDRYPNTFIINSDIDDDDYIQIVTRTLGSDKWLPVYGSLEANTSVPCRGNEIYYNVNVQVVDSVPFEFHSYSAKDRSETNYIESEGTYSYNMLKGNLFIRNGMYHYDINQSFPIFYINGVACPVFKNEFELENEYDYNKTQAEHFNISYVFPTKNIRDVSIRVENCMATRYLQIDNSTAGSLSTLIPESKAAGVRSLKISGDINVTDLNYIREKFCVLTCLDLEDANIVAGIIPDTFRSFQEKYYFMSEELSPANTIPACLFKDNTFLKEIKFPNNLVSIENKAFYNCFNLNYIDIPETVESLGYLSFGLCDNLKRVIVHNDNVRTFDAQPFCEPTDMGGNMIKLGELLVPSEYYNSYSRSIWKTWFTTVNPYSSSEDIAPEKIKNDPVTYHINNNGGYTLWEIYSELPATVSIPDKLTVGTKEYPVNAISEEPVKSNSDLELTLNYNIASLPSYSFQCCKCLKKVEILGSITRIPEAAFYNCRNLEEVILPETVQYIGSNAFGECGNIKNFHIPRDLSFNTESPTHDEVKQCLVYSLPIPLNNYSVGDGNNYFGCEEGLLYSKDGNTLWMVPAEWNNHDFLRVPEHVVNISDFAFEYNKNLQELVLPTASIDYRLPENLCKLTLTSKDLVNFGLPFPINTLVFDSSVENISSYNVGNDNCCIGLNNIIKTKSNLDLSPMKSKQLYYIWVSSPYCTPDVSASAILYVPGGRENRPDKNEYKMWEYQIDRKNGLVKVQPLIHNIAITSVLINGVEPSCTDYLYSADIYGEFSVQVNYDIIGLEQMTTVYDTAFNSQMKDTELLSNLQIPSIRSHEDNDSGIAIFTIEGKNVKSDTNLESGIYIVVRNGKVSKIRR